MSDAPNSDVALGQRLEAMLERAGISPVRASEIAAVSANTMRRWLKGESTADVHGLARITAITGESLDWLVSGLGYPAVLSPERKEREEIEVDRKPIAVPVYDIGASAGSGAEPLNELPDSHIVLPGGFIDGLGKQSDLAFLYVDGDSMAPLIPHGSAILVDRSKRAPREAIFVVRLDKQLYIKRLRVLGGRQIELASDNPAFGAITVDLAVEDDFAIIGQVVWVGKAVR